MEKSPHPRPRHPAILLYHMKLLADFQTHANNCVPGSSSTSVPRNRQPSHAGRRRSTVLMNLQLNDPTLPPPGEMVNESPISAYRTASPQPLTGSPIYTSGDPHHYRTLSLGEIHQELEQEQEAQVVCYLWNIMTLADLHRIDSCR